MPSVLQIDVDGIAFADPFARQILNSTDRMFHITNTVTGTKRITQKASGVNTPHTTNTTHTLDTCHPLATHLIGAFRITPTGSANPSGVPGFGWFSAGGTYIHWFDGTTMTSAGVANNPGFMSEIGVWAQYTPRVSGGSFLLDEWVHIFGYTAGGFANMYTLYEFDFEYRLKAGLFTV